MLAIAALLAAGCHVSSRRAPITITVRDKLTREPVPDARVDLRTVHFFVPIEALGSPIFDGSPPRSASGVTGANGSVRLDIVTEHPVQIVVVAAGYEPQCVELEKHPSLWTERERLESADRWRDSDPGVTFNGGPPRMEVRVSGSSRPG